MVLQPTQGMDVAAIAKVAFTSDDRVCKDEVCHVGMIGCVGPEQVVLMHPQAGTASRFRGRSRYSASGDGDGSPAWLLPLNGTAHRLISEPASAMTTVAAAGSC